MNVPEIAHKFPLQWKLLVTMIKTVVLLLLSSDMEDLYWWRNSLYQLCPIPFLMKPKSKWSEWSALKKQSQHCTQLLSNSSARQGVLRFSFQRYMCRENISEVHRRKLSLWNAKRETVGLFTSDPRYTIQTSECHLLRCQTGNNTKKLRQEYDLKTRLPCFEVNIS